jgi:hypothetical protein
MIFTKTGYKLSYNLTHPHKVFMHWMRDIKCAWQRANKGYCFRDLWNIDLWFIEIMPQMIQELKECKMGYPDGLSEKEWDDILDAMIQCFKEAHSETTSFVNPYEDEYCEKIIPVWMSQFKNPEKDPDVKDCYILKSVSEMDISEELKELDRKHYETEKEKNQFMKKNKKKGLELFVKYFDNLWS